MAKNERLVKSNTSIISLGGSLIVPDEIDTVFLKSFIDFIKKRVAEGERFILIAGGGRICRRYIKAAADLGIDSEEKRDWVGIYVTRLNGNFLRILLGDLAFGEVILNPKDLRGIRKPVAVAAGWKPGCSTDFDTVTMAKEVKAERIVNLTNIDFVYDKNPNQFPDAKKIEKISWPDFRKIIPENWKSGLNSPFDPVASACAEKLGLEVIIMNGRDLNNLENYFDGKPFKGTVIGGKP